MQRRVGLALMAALVLAACGGQTPAASGPVAIDDAAIESSSEMARNVPIIVMLGDSLTAGFQLPAGAALPAALQRELDARGVEANFLNAGVSGDTTADGLNRYDWSVAEANADLLVIALGANDFLSGVSPETARRNLAAILGKAREQNLPAILLGVTIPGAQHDEREAAYASIYPGLAAEFGVPYYPDMMGAVSARPGLLMPDGLHPTAEGVEAMAEAIAGFLAPLIEDLD